MTRLVDKLSFRAELSAMYSVARRLGRGRLYSGARIGLYQTALDRPAAHAAQPRKRAVCGDGTSARDDIVEKLMNIGATNCR
jgi:hypothetical protein